MSARIAAQERLWRATLTLEYMSPCQREPEKWLAPGENREKPEIATARMIYVLEKCAECRVRIECKELLSAEDEERRLAKARPSSGLVWAGEIRYDPLRPTINGKVKRLLAAWNSSSIGEAR